MDWNEIRLMDGVQPFNVVPEGTEIISIVGVSFVPEYPQNLLNLVGQDEVWVSLVRNPNNEYDKNAIEVRCGEQMLGHIPKDVAARMAPKMDAGNQFLGRVHYVRVSPENPNNPGLDILVGEWS